jgi:hypothetical protein
VGPALAVGVGTSAGFSIPGLFIRVLFLLVVWVIGSFKNRENPLPFPENGKGKVT